MSFVTWHPVIPFFVINSGNQNCYREKNLPFLFLPLGWCSMHTVMGCALKAIGSFQIAPHWYSLLMLSFLLPLVHLLQRVISLSRSSFLGEGIDTRYLFTIFICPLNYPKILWKFIVRLKCNALLIMITTWLSFHEVFHFYSLACFVAYNILTFVPSFYCMLHTLCPHILWPAALHMQN